MFFHLTGIKDISDKNYSLELLIEGEDVSSVKQFLSDQKVIVLGLEYYTGKPEDFGTMYLDIEGKNQVFRIVGQLEKLEEFLSYVVKLELKVTNANYFLNPLDEKKVQSLIQTVNKQAEHQAQIKKQEKEKAEKKGRLNYNDKKLKKAYNAIDQIINQIDQLLAIGGRNIPPMTLKKFDDMRGEISKLRLATNYDKIIEELHKAMNLIVETQDLLLWKLESDKIFTIAPKSQVTNIEVIREQTRLAKANLLNALGAQLSREETMYVSLWYLKLFSQYLYKDIQFASQNRLLFVQQVFKGIELMLLFILTEMSILAVFANQLWINLSFQKFWIIFIYWAILAGLFRLSNEYLKPKNLSQYGLLLIWILGIYGGIIHFIKIILVF